MEKHQNRFQQSDLLFVQGIYQDSNAADVGALSQFLNGGREHGVKPYTGTLTIREGQALAGDYTVLNARSTAEQVRFAIAGHPYSGEARVAQGKLVNTELEVSGLSLIHSAQLTTLAFTRGFFGQYGQYIVSIGLLLFAFSTSIAWSYYGDRAITYLLGVRWVMPYRVFYVAGFFWASFSDTTLVWNLAAVAIVLMTLPNLVGILLLHKEMKQTVADYWADFFRNRSEKRQ